MVAACVSLLVPWWSDRLGIRGYFAIFIPMVSVVGFSLLAFAPWTWRKLLILYFISFPFTHIHTHTQSQKHILIARSQCKNPAISFFSLSMLNSALFGSNIRVMWNGADLIHLDILVDKQLYRSCKTSNRPGDDDLCRKSGRHGWHSSLSP